MAPAARTAGAELSQVLLGYVREAVPPVMPGCDGLTRGDVLRQYADFAARRAVPVRDELLRRHPRLAAEIGAFFDAAAMAAEMLGTAPPPEPRGRFGRRHDMIDARPPRRGGFDAAAGPLSFPRSGTPAVPLEPPSGPHTLEGFRPYLKLLIGT